MTAIDREEARVECVLRGYDLATVSSHDENSLIYSIVTNSHICWIGLNDILVDGEYVSADGTSSTYARWAHGQPSGSGEDCVITYDHGYWHDVWCPHVFSCYFCSRYGEILKT